MQQRVLITGASGGIGRALCRAFAARGDLIFGQYHNNAAAMAELQRELGEALIPLQADLSDPAGADELAAKVLPRGADVLVNNAGLSLFGLFQSVPQADADRLFRVNTESVLRLTRLLLPAMLGRKCGCVVNISSMWGRSGASCEVDYSASKAAVIGFTKALAKEVGPSGVTVNCVAPGFIDTPMNVRLTAEERQAILDETPLCRAGTPQDVAAAVLFLASEQAAFITGQVLGVDGGIV